MLAYSESEDSQTSNQEPIPTVVTTNRQSLRNEQNFNHQSNFLADLDIKTFFKMQS
jgi:hypothetical protein